MDYPQQYFSLKILYKQLYAKSTDTGYTVNEIRQSVKRAIELINELAQEHPSEEIKKAHTTALTLLEKALNQADSYYRDYDHTKRESRNLSFMDVLQPALEAIDLFLHTAF